jgi:glutaminyl-tRNA synthetase
VSGHLNRIAYEEWLFLIHWKVVITNYTGEEEILHSENNPEDEKGGQGIPFMLNRYRKGGFYGKSPKKYFRLAPGQMVRLKSAYIIKCDEVIKDAAGTVQKFVAPIFLKVKVVRIQAVSMKEHCTG